MRFFGRGKTAKRIVTETVPWTSYQNTCQQPQQSDGQPGVLGSDPAKLFRQYADPVNGNGGAYIGQGIQNAGNGGHLAQFLIS